jgi:hypothetical protein
MIDIVDELRSVVEKLDEHGIEYALWGGMAMAVHGFLRMTIDIDFLIPSESVDEAMKLAGELGYTVRGKDLSFKGGAVEIRRISKPDPQPGGDVLPLDFLLVTPPIKAVWDSRVEVEWEGGRFSVVSRDGLIELKKLRANSQDAVDIERLLSKDDNT